MVRGAAFSLSALAAGAASGAALGLAGSQLPRDARAGLASIVGVVLLAVGALELLSGKARVLECRRETPRNWVYRQRPLVWAVENGLALGCGAFSRLGFALWYVVPAAAFLSGSVAVGAIVYGAYGFVRGTSVWPIMLVARLAGRDGGEWLLLRARAARTVAAVQLVAIAAAVVVGVGL